MSSIRKLKKDINFLASELITQAYLNNSFFKRLKDDDYRKLVEEVLKYRSELISRSKYRNENKDPKLIRTYYKQLRLDMIEAYNTLIDEINKNID